MGAVTVERPSPSTAAARPGADGGTAPGPPRRDVRAVFGAVCLVLATVAGGVALAPSYAEPGAVRIVLGAAAVVSVAVTLLLSARTAAVAALLGGSPIALGGVVAVAAWRPPLAGFPPEQVASALVHSGAHILTSAAPTPVNVDTLTLPMLATWLAGAAAAHLWHRRRGGAALVPPVLLLVGAVVLNGPVAPPGYLAVGLLAAAAAGLFAVSGADARAAQGAPGGAALRVGLTDADGGTAVPRGPLRLRAVGAAGLALLAVLVTTVAGPAAVSGWEARPYDPRSAVSPPTPPAPALNPLGYLSEWAAEPDRPLLTVRAGEPAELRWVALGEFTGTTWLPEAGYRSAGTALPAPEPAPPHATEARVEVAVGELPGDWLPVPGAPRRIDAAGIGFDAVSGTVAALDGPAEGRRYTVTGDVGHWRAAEMADARVPADAALDRYRELPAGAPPLVTEIVAEIAASGPPHARAEAIARYLRETYTFDPEVPGGHGYANLANLLVAPGEDGGGGTSEQFASAFAVIARAAGLPSRVVVGFGPGAPAGDGEFQVRTGDAVAWGEVYLSGFGWVPFDVTPGGEDAGGSAAPETGSIAESEAPEPENSPTPPEEDDPAASGHREPAGTRWGVIVVVAAGAVLGLAVLALVGVPVLRWLRTRRRLAAPDPGDRVLGAWHELRDGLRLAGAALPASGTAAETVALANGLLATGEPGRRLPELAYAVNIVGFAATGWLTAGAAERIVADTRGYLAELRAGQRRLRRLTWWLDPRPLFWRAP
ncbi:transglutaminaseTgpA domain-containing protein [Marinactinospora rubrisoli]|uniref:TransglutaminaseTgpA domain-containing protein n=1 Tax=Marinactinospora rubrisoli TaxID=2715399 RepID=A0ABW2KBB9_9ACTN